MLDRIMELRSAMDEELKAARERVRMLETATAQFDKVFGQPKRGGVSKALARGSTVKRAAKSPRLTVNGKRVGRPPKSLQTTAPAAPAKQKRVSGRIGPSHPLNRVRTCACGAELRGPSFFIHSKTCPSFNALDKAGKERVISNVRYVAPGS